jgi:electron-transferring-flavoprotein dehydrogenase
VLGERGVDREGNHCENYMPGEVIRAKVTVFADGSFGPLSTKVIRSLGLQGRNPQVYSLGLKQLIKLPAENRFGANRVVHTIGYPNKWDVFGGGFLYDMGDQLASLGLVIGLDWRYGDLNPQQELELLKSHPFIAGLLEGGEVVAAGAKTIPEGGYYSMPTPYADGALLIGDAAGLVNMKKLKGIHLAVRSGIAAGDTIAQCLASGDFSGKALAGYARRLEENGVMREMRSARNMRQGFATPLGLFLGAPLSMLQHLFPVRFRIAADRGKTGRTSIRRTYRSILDRKTFVGLSGTMHDEEFRSHIRIINRELCKECLEELGGPCTTFCPGEVYASCEENNDHAITVSSADCMHCKTCAIKCPRNNIEWVSPEGGMGPKFRRM